ncbi:MAG: transglutaminase TgpA family protein [Anaerolineae bacterium]|jgi:transglutaminase-like putative cysteine protease|nr:DUF4129 domain-containing protein [Chloroflexota bacterium]
MTAGALQHRRERADWLLYLLLVVAVVSLPLSILSSGWVPEAERLLGPALWSLLAAAILSRTRLRTGPLYLVGLAGGLLYAVQYATGLFPGLGLLLGDAMGAVGWAVEWASTRAMPQPLPFAESSDYLVSHLQASEAAVRGWLSAVQGGGTGEDVTVLLFLVALVVWLLAWNAAVAMLRQQQAMRGLLPLGIAVVTNSAITRQGVGYVQMYIAAMLLILAYANMTRMHAVWEKYGVDFSTELRRDSLLAGALIAAVALVLALATPYTTYNRAVYAFWDRFGPRLEALYDELDRAFAGRNPVEETEQSTPRDIAVGVLPHDVGLGADVSDRTVMLVTISDPPPPPMDELERMTGSESEDPRRFVERRYWRQRTYDQYNGSGWDTSEPAESTHMALEPWRETLYPQTVLTQTFTLLAVRGDIVFGVNEPVAVDQDYQVLTRADEDLVALSVDADEYTVVSHVPQPTVEELRAAEDAYPAEIAERYLALPEIPQRVADLAQEIVATSGAETRYDKAKAIEAYLRGYAYDLDVSPPPLDQDIVEYFLFDLQRGYCDYSATSMVVMLRAVGIASRYASGFGMGEYDYYIERWRVTGKNAHAWPEVYFPGLGWIEFEPTPSEIPRVFAGGTSDYQLPERPRMPEESARRTVDWESLGVAVLVLALAGGLAAAVSGVVPYRPAQRTDSRHVIGRVYRSLVRRAAWLKQYPEQGQTPGEFLSALSQFVEQRGTFSGSAARDLSLIRGAYEQARYGLYAPSDGQRDEALQAWNRLKPAMFRLMFVRTQRSG